jgi:hypothetical protein
MSHNKQCWLVGQLVGWLVGWLVGHHLLLLRNLGMCKNIYECLCCYNRCHGNGVKGDLYFLYAALLLISIQILLSAT